MLNYQSTSFHDALYLRKALNLRPAPEFEAWLRGMDLMDDEGGLRPLPAQTPLLALQGADGRVCLT